MREVKREGGEREYTGRGVGEIGAWSLEGRSDYIEGVEGNVYLMLHLCGYMCNYPGSCPQ